MILSGMFNLEQMDDNVRTVSSVAEISEEEQQLIEKACSIVHSGVSVPCTKYRYCTPNYPIKLDIPMLLSYYNKAKSGDTWRLGNLPSAAKEKLP